MGRTVEIRGSAVMQGSVYGPASWALSLQIASRFALLGRVGLKIRLHVYF